MSTDDRTIDERKREIEAQLTDYEASLRAAMAWFAQWQEKRRGYRCKRTA